LGEEGHATGNRRKAMAMKYRLIVKDLMLEHLPPVPREHTTDRPISEEARRIITAAQVEAIRRVRRAQSS
jgi:hypothetical protein